MTRRKDTGDIVYLAGCIGEDEHGKKYYQTQIFDNEKSCEILCEDDIIFEEHITNETIF